MYSEKDNQVTLTMSRSDYEQLLLCIGAAAATFGMNSVLELADRLNEGNPNWAPYIRRDKSGH